MNTSSLISIALVILVSLLAVLPAMKKSPFGLIAALLLILAVTLVRDQSLAALGFTAPESWLQTLWLALLFGTLLAFASTLLVEPLADRLTSSKHDLSAFESLRGNFKLLLQWMPVVWIWVALVEEIIFRGFLLNELRRILGDTGWGLALSLVLSALVFGLAHWYQGKSGVISTGLIGFFIGCIFAWGGYNLWLVILTHGFIDTVGLALIYANADTWLKQRLPGAQRG